MNAGVCMRPLNKGPFVSRKESLECGDTKDLIISHTAKSVVVTCIAIGGAK